VPFGFTEVVVSGFNGTLQMLDRRDNADAPAPQQAASPTQQQTAPASQPPAADPITPLILKPLKMKYWRLVRQCKRLKKFWIRNFRLMLTISVLTMGAVMMRMHQHHNKQLPLPNSKLHQHLNRLLPTPLPQLITLGLMTIFHSSSLVNN
jgi:hypothetical protein